MPYAPIMHEAFRPIGKTKRQGALLSGLRPCVLRHRIVHDDRVSRGAQNTLTVSALGLITFAYDRRLGIEMCVARGHDDVVGLHTQAISRALPKVEVRPVSTTCQHPTGIGAASTKHEYVIILISGKRVGTLPHASRECVWTYTRTPR
jgi:hypothetical protein